MMTSSASAVVNRRRSISRLLSIQNQNESSSSSSSSIESNRLEILIEKLKLGRIDNAADFFQASPIDLMITCNLSYDEVDFILKALSKSIAQPKFLGRASDIYRTHVTKTESSSRYLSTGSQSFDEILRGGLAMGSLVEICGQPGVGKTQFCMSVCAQALKRSQSSSSLNHYGVIYYDTELKFDATRLAEILSGRSSFSPTQVLSPPEISYSQLKFQIKRPVTCKELLDDIETLQSVVMSEGVVLIVVDSIAALARREGLTEMDKEKYIVRQASTLKRIAELCNCVVLTTNQVVPESTGSRKGQNIDVDVDILNDLIRDETNMELHPALGLAWHHCVTTRFILSIQYNNNTNSGVVVSTAVPFTVEQNIMTNNIRRFLRLTKNPLLPNFSREYCITNRGFEVLNVQV